MDRLSRAFLITLLAGIAGLACGGDSSTGPRPGSTTSVTGSGQEGPTGATLATPLSFVVLASDGAPLAGATVTWQIVSGTASVNPASTTTNAAGLASTTVTLGTTVGPVLVRGTVSGLAPVEFNLQILAPCDYAAPYTFGSTVNGTLTTTDCHIQQRWYYDFYQFNLTAQQGLVATMSSTALDAYLEFYRIIGQTADPLAVGDDISAANTNAQIHAIVPAGTYELAANTGPDNQTGSYTLTTASRPQTVSGCELIWFAPGIMINDGVAATDCAPTVGGTPGNADGSVIFARAGTVLKLKMQSAALDPLLMLRLADSARTLVASNDDSATTTNTAFISHTVAQDAFFFLFLGTATAGETGAYTFEFTATPPPAGVAAETKPLVSPRVRFTESWKSVRRAGRSY